MKCLKYCWVGLGFGSEEGFGAFEKAFDGGCSIGEEMRRFGLKKWKILEEMRRECSPHRNGLFTFQSGFCRVLAVKNSMEFYRITLRYFMAIFRDYLE